MTLEFAATHRERHPKHMGEDMMNDLGPMCMAKLVCLKNQVRRVGWVVCVRLGVCVSVRHHD